MNDSIDSTLVCQLPNLVDCLYYGNCINAWPIIYSDKSLTAIFKNNTPSTVSPREWVVYLLSSISDLVGGCWVTPFIVLFFWMDYCHFY